MRPPSIVNFERVVLLWLAIFVINTIVSYDEMIASVATLGLGSGFVLGTQGATLAVMLLLLWLIGRKGSPVAKWIYAVLTVLALVSGVVGLSQTPEWGNLPVILSVVQYVLLLVSLYLLFRGDTKPWFADGRGEETETVY
jgi:hypothetical protein